MILEFAKIMVCLGGQFVTVEVRKLGASVGLAFIWEIAGRPFSVRLAPAHCNYSMAGIKINFSRLFKKQMRLAACMVKRSAPRIIKKPATIDKDGGSVLACDEVLTSFKKDGEGG